MAMAGTAANVSVEIDKRTADVLQTRAEELGLTVAQLIAELAALDSQSRQAGANRAQASSQQAVTGPSSVSARPGKSNGSPLRSTPSIVPLVP